MASSLLPSSKIDDNCDSTPFYSILGLYCRSPYGQLLSTEGRFSQLMRRHWSPIFEQLILGNITSTRLSSTVVVETRSFDLASEDFARQVSSSSQHHVALKSREVYRVASRCYVGLLCHRSHQSSDSASREWIETFLVSHTTLKPPAVPKELKIPVRRDYGKGWQRIIWSSTRARKKTLERRSEELVTRDCESIAEEITLVFESMLRNIAPRDEWDMVGRAHFHRLVANFVSRNEACQMVLPAFPCKSPNKDKVGGSDPDMAEHIALETLRDFVRAVRKIYKPGATIWIIHDGHLLSSCIGVGDDAISEYETRLAELYRSIANSPEDRDSVKFISLSDLFFPPGAHDGMRKTLDEAWLDDPRILIHPLPNTKLLPEAELARKLVMASCGINRAHLRTLIKEQDAATLRTYRGLSRFMLQDLPAMGEKKSQSTSQRKKIATAVAAEMMARNQAYSNLVELLFPDYVRLSIHAHSNCGPKFGVRLFPRDRVRAVDNLMEDRNEPKPVYDFQTPTPWHNCIVRVVGDNMAYLTRASAARQAMESGIYSGGWMTARDGRGGHYLLGDSNSDHEGDGFMIEAAKAIDVVYVDHDGEPKERERTSAILGRRHGKPWHVSISGLFLVLRKPRALVS